MDGPRGGQEKMHHLTLLDGCFRAVKPPPSLRPFSGVLSCLSPPFCTFPHAITWSKYDDR